MDLTDSFCIPLAPDPTGSTAYLTDQAFVGSALKGESIEIIQDIEGYHSLEVSRTEIPCKDTGLLQL